MNTALIEINQYLDLAWGKLDCAANVSYNEGYASIQMQVSRLQLEILRIQSEIEDKEYGDE